MGSVPPDESRYFVDADFDHGCDRVSMKSIKIPRCQSRYSYYMRARLGRLYAAVDNCDMNEMEEVG